MKKERRAQCKKARARKRDRERKRAQSALYLLFFLEARDLINRITQGLMKSELPSHLRLYTRPSRCSCYVKTEIFPGNTFPPLHRPFTRPLLPPIPPAKAEGRQIASEKLIRKSINSFRRISLRTLLMWKNELLRCGAYYRKIIGDF